MTEPQDQSSTLFGHPVGLFTLFFAEMWERFSYYGMRALLVLYMIKGFLGYSDNQAYEVYGAYTALVYATPFLGGLLADRLLGARLAVVLGGLLMAAGHLMMTLEYESAFFVALALLICGNGFFKPNISTIVGTLYPKQSAKKDSAFTIFYMGVNMGAALAPVLCGYVGETYGWHYGFGLATVGMLVGVAIFVAPTRLTQVLIGIGAAGTAASLPFLQNSLLQLAVRGFLGVALLAAGVIAVVALGRGGVPKEAGAPPAPERLKRLGLPVLRENFFAYYGTLCLAAVGLLAAGYLFEDAGFEPWMVIVIAGAAALLPWASAQNAVFLGVLAAVPLIAMLVQRNTIAGYLLILFGLLAFGSLIVEAFRASRIERERLFVVLTMFFFSMLFWAFFEQAGSSINNFTDRNIDRVFESRRLTAQDVNTTLEFRISPRSNSAELAELPLLSQEQLGYPFKGKPFTLSDLARLRERAAQEDGGQQTLRWPVTEAHVGMGIGSAEVPASEFQAANPIFILLFGLVFSALWAILAARGLEPSTPVKFAFGLLQLGLGFAALWFGANQADERGMVAIPWLLLGYLLHTTGELCLSPVGLSMVTKLSPTRIVSTVMGAWFLATAFSNYLAGMIAKLTGLPHEAGGEQLIPPPAETLGLYHGVFGKIALTAILSAVICFAIAPLLKHWMHSDVEGDVEV